MAQHQMFQTTAIQPLLAERGVQLSREQVYRLVTQPPQRLNVEVLAALCDILSCTPNDLLTVEAHDTAIAVNDGERSSVRLLRDAVTTSLTKS